MISALLLAAGESRRMGEFKQLLSFGGKTFVECCVDNLLASGAGEVIVVTGHRSEDVQKAVINRPVKCVYNPDYRAGMSASIKRGVGALAEGARAVMIALADQPQIESDVCNRIIEAYEKERPLVVVPVYDGRRGHPIILDLSLRDEILSLDPAQGLRQVVDAHKSEVHHIEVATADVLIDCDFPEDYRRLSGR